MLLAVKRSTQGTPETCIGCAFVLLIVFIFCSSPTGAQTTEYFDYSLFGAATQDLTMIDFDELDPGDGVLTGSEYVGLGLTIVQRDGDPMNIIEVGVGFAFIENANSQPNVISSSITLGGGFDNSRSDNYDFIFSDPATAGGIWVGNVEPGSTVVQFLDAQEAVLAEETFAEGHDGIIGSSGGRNRVFYGVTSVQHIKTIRTIELANDGSDGVSYDDVQFGDIIVPVRSSSWGQIKVLFR